MTQLGTWFEQNFDRYSAFKAISPDTYVCHEIGAYVGEYENAVKDGYYESFPLHRKDALAYAYDMYMRILPKGHRYQTKKYFEELAEKVVHGMEDAWKVQWCPDGINVPLLR